MRTIEEARDLVDRLQTLLHEAEFRHHPNCGDEPVDWCPGCAAQQRYEDIDEEADAFLLSF